MGDDVLVGAVVIHGPYFFSSGAVAHEINFGFGDAGNTSAQAEDDLVGKLVSDDANSVRSSVVVVLLAQHLRGRRCALDVVEPTLHLNLVRGYSQVAEGEHGGVRRRGNPVSCIQFGRLSGHLLGLETFRDEIENAGIVEIVE